MFSSQAAIPAALAVHVITIAATLALSSRARWCRRITFGGSAVASALMLVAAADVLGSGRPVAGVLFAHHASGVIVDFAVTPLSAWFLLVMGTLGVPIAIYSIGYIAHAVPPSRTAAVGTAFNMLMAAVAVVFVVDNVIGFLFAWELMTLATAMLVATEYESRESRRAAYLYLLMSHIGTGALVAGFFTLVSLSGSVSLSASLTGDVASGATPRVLVLAVPGRIRREGRHDPAARVAARSAPGRAGEHLGADVGRPDHRRHLRSVPRLRVRTRHPGNRVGTGRDGRRDAVGYSRRPVCARPERPEATAGLQHDRKRRHHPARTRREHDPACGESPGAGDGRGLREPLSRPQSRGLQRALIPGRRERGCRHRDAPNRATWRRLETDADDRAVLPDRRDGHFRLAPAQWFRERVAHVPVAAARVPVRARSDPREFSAGGRHPGADERPRGGLFRQGLWHLFSGTAKKPCRRSRPRITGRDGDPDGDAGPDLPGAGSVSGSRAVDARACDRVAAGIAANFRTGRTRR